MIKRIFSVLIITGALLMTAACDESELDTSLLSNPNNPVVKIETNMGDLFIELYADNAPISAKNFLDYSKSGFYEDTIFHRVINGFMIQGGGFDKDLKQKKTEDPIKNEAINGLSNKRGTVAMARTQIVDSATSQFFINVNDNTFLDHRSSAPHEYGYAVFGNVIDGMSVVDAIKQTKTTSVPPYDDVPVSEVVIEKVLVIKD